MSYPVYSEMWEPAPFTSSDTFLTYNGSPLLDGETYYGRLKISNGTAWSEWFEFSFRMNSVPTIPVPLSPIDDSNTSSTPTLWVSNSTDAEGDSLYYDFFGTKDSDFGIVLEPLLNIGNVPEGLDSTGVTIMSALEENIHYSWLVRAYDGYEYSSWDTLTISNFWVNEINEAPTPPIALNPNEFESPLYNLQPTFVWGKSNDPDPGDVWHYKLYISIDSNFNFVTSIDSIPHDFLAIPQIDFLIPYTLDAKEQYWWKVQAIDKLGSSSFSNVQTFWTSCCIGIRGNVNGDALEQIDISDLVYLVTYMFQGGTEPLCMDEANIDGLSSLDISDLVGLVAYMFQGGNAPAVCP